MSLSAQQKAIVELPLDPLSVTACAGSGKTRTAVHRLAHMRRTLNDDHGLIALLSFSNVAVDTFRRDYDTLMRTSDPYRRSSAVEIDTVDGFITSNILRPHAHRTLGCDRAPYLVDGHEPFLKNFTVYDGQRPHPTTDLRVSLDGDNFRFEVGTKPPKAIAAAEAQRALAKLGKVGAYTHASGRYWAHQTLKQQPFVLRALARRYPHILVDEAQDIGPEHQAILELLVAEGSKLSLIGDPNQGIYDFAGANGVFLAGYGAKEGVIAKNLDINYRSVPAILNIANNLSGRADKPDRAAPEHLSGAYYITYLKTEKQKALDTFRSMVEAAKVDLGAAVVLCRGSEWVGEWSGGEAAQGQGIVKSFVDAVICRDKLGLMDQAYRHACSGIIGLLANKHGDLAHRLSRSTLTAPDLLLRRAIWGFARDHDTGLPSGQLLADTQWHPLLAQRVKAFLIRLETDYGLAKAENLGQKLANKALENKPLIQTPDLAGGGAAFRVSTVHKVKGESLDAVMYVTNRDHVRSLLGGTGTEVGRIGYVAVTRARNLFVLAVPENCLAEFEPVLRSKGFAKPGTQ